AKPGGINYASAGIGSGTHLNGEQFKHAAGIDVVHVPYKGPAEALLDTATGRVHYFISPLVPALPFIRDGRLIPLGVTTAQRAGAAGGAHRGRVRVTGLRVPGVVRRVRSGGNAAAGRRAHRAGDRARGGPSRRRETVSGAGRGRADRHAGGIRRLRPRGDREV